MRTMSVKLKRLLKMLTESVLSKQAVLTKFVKNLI